MFLPPLLLLPLALALALYRLYRVPRMLRSGQLTLRPGPLRVGVTVAAYVGLLACTIGAVLMAAQALVGGDRSVPRLLSMAGALAGYPLACVIAEWAFYHGFERAKRGPR